MEKLTIVTPTYNRAHTLPAVYDSLTRQTSRDFIWMIVDDGSTDTTQPLVRQWAQEGKIRIQYFKKENGGKASALNLAIENLESEYAVCLDSDDLFYPHAVALALSQLETVAEADYCCGILALRNNPDGSVMGNVEIPTDRQYLTAQELFLNLGIQSELICFYKTKILQQYRFPEFPGEKFVSPAWMQYSITQNRSYKTSWDKFCQCEYCADGLTKNKRKVIVQNPRGYTCVKCFSFNLSPTLNQKIKHGIMYDCGCILGKDCLWLRNAKHKVLVVVLMPVAFAVYLFRFRKLRRQMAVNKKIQGREK